MQSNDPKFELLIPFSLVELEVSVNLQRHIRW